MSLKSLKYLEHEEANHFHHLAIIQVLSRNNLTKTAVNLGQT